MADAHRRYVPAAGRDWALPLYDPINKLLGGDATRRLLIEQARLQPGHRVLEIGCGTGALLMQIARMHPGVDLTGLDPDPKALERARRKAAARSLPIQLDRGFSDALPYPDASFDRVFSCVMFHHLVRKDEKRNTLREVRRVLKPGGRLQLVDFVGGPHGGGEAAEQRLLSLMEETGLADATLVRRRKIIFLLTAVYFAAVA
jgi:ubiquinone/menaquinone biosynthesis C-methylase UbiE